jgi:hypothetical protein
MPEPPRLFLERTAALEPPAKRGGMRGMAGFEAIFWRPGRRSQRTLSKMSNENGHPQHQCDADGDNDQKEFAHGRSSAAAGIRSDVVADCCQARATDNAGSIDQVAIYKNPGLKAGARKGRRVHPPTTIDITLTRTS